MAARRCPVNALEPFRFLGIQYEYLVLSVIVFVAAHMGFRDVLGTLGPFVSLATGIAFGQLLQKATQDQPGGWLQHVVLVWVSDPKRSRWVPGLAPMMEQEFQTRGALPPSGIRNHYEA